MPSGPARANRPAQRRPLLALRREGPPAAGPWDGLYIASVTRDLCPVVEIDGVALPGWDPVGKRLADTRES